MNWKVGDRAIVSCPESVRNHGKVVRILSGFGALGSNNGIVYIGYEVNIPAIYSNTHEFCIYENHELISIPDDKSTWSELEKIIDWNPTKEVCHVDIG